MTDILTLTLNPALDVLTTLLLESRARSLEPHDEWHTT